LRAAHVDCNAAIYNAMLGRAGGRWLRPKSTDVPAGQSFERSINERSGRVMDRSTSAIYDASRHP
jgi:hypothetical protein